MFGEKYKKAINAIQPDANLLSEILKKQEEAAQPHKRNYFIYGLIPVGICAAIILCVLPLQPADIKTDNNATAYNATEKKTLQNGTERKQEDIYAYTEKHEEKSNIHANPEEKNITQDLNTEIINQETTEETDEKSKEDAVSDGEASENGVMTAMLYDKEASAEASAADSDGLKVPDYFHESAREETDGKTVIYYENESGGKITAEITAIKPRAKMASGGSSPEKADDNRMFYDNFVKEGKEYNIIGENIEYDDFAEVLSENK